MTAISKIKAGWVQKLVKRDGTLCHYCRVELNFDNPLNPHYRTIDHRKPNALAEKVNNNINNLVLCCHKCNLKKGTQPYKLFMRQITK